MKTRKHFSSVFVMIVLVFMCVLGTCTSAWFTTSPSNTNIVVVIGQYDVRMRDGSGDITSFTLPSPIVPGGSFSQTLTVKNYDTAAVYVQVSVLVRADGVDVTSSNYVTLNYSSTYWTKSSENYKSKSSIAANGTLNLCSTITFASNIPEGKLIQIVVILRAKSTAY